MPDPKEIESQNARAAMKMIRREVQRILEDWDPLCLKGLGSFGEEYAAHVGPLAAMVRKRQPVGEIAQYLDKVVREDWNLPPTREKCFLIAEKIYRIGDFFYH